MRDPKNIAEIVDAGADMLGFIFFEKSKRYVEAGMELPLNCCRDVEKVGVFVNAPIDYVISKIADYRLDYVQLHGDESPEYCSEIRTKSDVKIIKVFSVGETFDFENTEKYTQVADLFLFDTKGKERGGNGVKFNWEILQAYEGEVPFLLSGGIRLADAQAVKEFQHPKLWGLDVNSGFESEPGIKKADEVQKFVETTPRAV